MQNTQKEVYGHGVKCHVPQPPISTDPRENTCNAA